MAIAVTAQQRAVGLMIDDWSARARTISAVRSLEDGGDRPWRALWTGLADLGVFGIAVPVEYGGAGGTVADLAVALEQAACALVPGPVLATALGGLVLARAGATGTRSGAVSGSPRPDRPAADVPAAKELLPAVAAGRATLAVATTPGTVAGAWRDGTLRVHGTVRAVQGAGGADHLLLTDGENRFVLDAGQAGVRVEIRRPLDFSQPIGDIHLADVAVTPDRLLPGLPAADVDDLAATLYAAEAAGVAGWCVRTAAAYAKVRTQFGRPIGSFQAVKHLCATMHCRAERAAAVAWDAARSAADAPPAEYALAAAVAAAVALDAAVDNAKDCIQVLGGVGFTWEHDAHLYLRRAVALRQLAGGTARWRRRAAELAVAGTRRRLTVQAHADEGVRQRVREIAELPPAARRPALADAGYLAPHWPRPYGLAATAAEQLAIDDELARAGVPRPDLAIGGWAAPTVIGYGTDAQRERFAGPTLRGEISWCQLFSEPEAGSDLASVRTRAVRADGGWRLTGQKVWTSLAREADWAICLARTDPDAPRHRGLTYFLVAMGAPGIDVRPLREITGRAVFNEVFLDDVYVPDDCVVGAPGDGWRLARATLATERVAIGRGSSFGDGVETILGTVTAAGADLDLIGGLVADGLAVSLLDLRATLRRLDAQPDGHGAGHGAGHGGGDDSAVRKLVGVAHRQAVAEAALTLSGPGGAVAGEETYEFLLSRCLSIAGGSTQILQSVVGERVLGLPREVG